MKTGSHGRRKDRGQRIGSDLDETTGVDRSKIGSVSQPPVTTGGLVSHEFLGTYHQFPTGVSRSDTLQVVDGSGSIEFRSLGQYSVLDFGAIGDGVTEDTAAIQSALDTAATDNRALFVPPGYVFRCRKLKLPSNTTIFGVRGKSKLLLLGDTTDGQDVRYGMILDGATGAKTNISIFDLVIYGLNEDTAVSNNVCNIAICATGSAAHTDLVIEGCEFYYFRSRVFFQDNLGTITRLRFLSNRVHDIGTTTMNLHVPGSPPPVSGPADVTVSALTPGTCIDALVSGNFFHDIGTSGNHWTIYCSRNTKFLTIANNLTFNCIGGYKLQNANHEQAIISGNQFRSLTARQAIIIAGGPGPVTCNSNSIAFAAGNTSPAIQIADISTVTCNNNIVDLGGNSSDGGVFEIHNVSGVTLSCNAAENGNTTQGAAVGIFSNATETTEDITISGNVFRDAGSIGLFVLDSAGTLKNVSFIGNTVKAPRGVVMRDGEDFQILDNNFIATGKTMEFDVANSTRALISGNRGSGTGIWYSGTNHIIEDNSLEAQPQPSVTDSGSKVRRNSLPATSTWVSISNIGGTPSVISSDRFLLSYAVANTITNFMDGRDGETKTFIATTANATIAHTAGQILLAGAVNYTMATDDVIQLVNRGGVWYEVSRK